MPETPALLAALIPTSGLTPLQARAFMAAQSAVPQLRGVPPMESARLTALGHLAAGRQLAKAVTRVWWPLALAVAIGRRYRELAKGA